MGLAQALVSEPEILILDEPTVGLDPKQVAEVRTLVKQLAGDHTVILSTHILPEVEMTCDSVIIIHRGQVVASGALDELGRQAGARSTLVAEFEGSIDSAPVMQLPQIVHLDREKTPEGIRFRITTDNEAELSPRLCALSVEHGWKLRELRPQRQTLEEMFLRIVEEEEPVRH